MLIAMDEGWFDVTSLVAMACGNQQELHTPVDCAAHLWEPFLAVTKLSQTGVIDETKWQSPYIDRNLRVPPRIHGGRETRHW